MHILVPPTLNISVSLRLSPSKVTFYNAKSVDKIQEVNAPPLRTPMDIKRIQKTYLCSINWRRIDTNINRWPIISSHSFRRESFRCRLIHVFAFISSWIISLPTYSCRRIHFVANHFVADLFMSSYSFRCESFRCRLIHVFAFISSRIISLPTYSCRRIHFIADHFIADHFDLGLFNAFAFILSKIFSWLHNFFYVWYISYAKRRRTKWKCDLTFGD